MKVTAKTKINDLLDERPEMLDFLVSYHPKFGLLKNPSMRKTLGRFATLEKAAGIAGIDTDTLVADVNAALRETNAATGAGNREQIGELKEIIRDLHRGKAFDTVKARFDALMSAIAPGQIAVMEEELIREGMPSSEIQKLCDLHVSVFRDALDESETADMDTPPGHPVATYTAENGIFGEIVCELDAAVASLGGKPASDDDWERLSDILGRLANITLHYTRKENELFPALERHDITGPSQVMWGIHDEIRGMLKQLASAAADRDAGTVVDMGPKLSRAVTEMIYKEQNILFPMAMESLDDHEWAAIRAGEDELGYAFVIPGDVWKPETAAPSESPASPGAAGDIRLSEGMLTPEQVNLLLSHLPLDITFVDEHDTVRYYSDTPHRVFPRSPGIIGRKVQNCHPQSSVHVVNRILEGFRSGGKDTADFRIRMEGQYIYIRYLAVRDESGAYRGCVEVTQEISGIQRLEGEQRLLDWEG